MTNKSPDAVLAPVIVVSSDIFLSAIVRLHTSEID
jgi:hypothetical protein